MTASVDSKMLGARADRMIKALAQISAEPNRLVRLFLSPEHRRAADLVAGWMREVGLAVSEDALGTVRGRTGDGQRLLIGSHLDSVIDGGHYDGPLGVVAGIIAAGEARVRGIPVAIDVLAFGDEEGSRFPSTLSSSAACAGAFDPSTLTLADNAGISLGDALIAYGKDPNAIKQAAYMAGDAAAYIEVHIEQGPALEAANQPLGVVTGIVGQSRFRVIVTGEAGHAGTVPMTVRHDALAGAAEMTLLAEQLAREHDGMVATVGRIEVSPGATNIIPGRVVFTVDLRCMADRQRHAAVRQFEEQARKIAATRGLSVEIEHFHEAAAAPCDPALQELVSAAITDVGGQPLRLPSGAGHDGQMMVRICPMAMMFVRCQGGISHNPAEYASPGDMGLAVAALIRFIDRFAHRS